MPVSVGQSWARLTISLLLVVTPLIASSTTGPVKTTVRYKVSSTGMNVGEVTTTQRFTDEGGVTKVQFETRTAVKASFLWMGYENSSIEKGVLDNGDLASYSHKGQENGKVFDVEGRLEGGSFHIEVQEQGQTRTFSIPRSSYDYTTMECPEGHLDFSAKNRISLRILDVEKMAVVKRDYQLVRNSNYTVSGKDHPCRIVDFSDPNKKARRWIAWDGSTIILYRQDSKGEKHSYSVQAVSVAKEM